MSCKLGFRTPRSPLVSSEEHAAGSELIVELSEKFGSSKNCILIELLQYNANKGLWSNDFVMEAAKIAKPVL